MDYFHKLEQNPAPDLAWNIPETRQETIKIIGGNSQNFRTVIKTSEFIVDHFPAQDIVVVLPDSLKPQLPDLSNFIFINSTDTGSFADQTALNSVLGTPDFNLVMGDLSKNSITGKIFSDSLATSLRPTLITRDTIDLIAEFAPVRLLMNDQLIFFASMPQLQKLFRAVYYPKMLLLSQSLIQVADALHKFTLSYPTKIITLHDGQILIAANGEVHTLPLGQSGYSPINFWQGELAAKIAIFNLYNPNNFLNATSCASFA